MASASENSVLLTDILKTQWHFPGQVQSEWGSDSHDHGITQDRVDDVVRRKLYSMIASGVMDKPPHGGEKIEFDAARTSAQSVRSASIKLDAKHTFHYRDSSTCQSQYILFDLNL
jgi:beta-glucosidase